MQMIARSPVQQQLDVLALNGSDPLAAQVYFLLQYWQIGQPPGS